MLDSVATTAALMAITRHRATGPHPEGRSAAEDKPGAELVGPRGSRAQAYAEHGGEEGRPRPLRVRGRAAPAAGPGVRVASRKGRGG
ncbi:hypothetical protein [Azospirillum doebereinerae]